MGCDKEDSKHYRAKLKQARESLKVAEEIIAKMELAARAETKARKHQSQMMEQESEVMESRLKSGHAELRSYANSQRELRNEVQKLKDHEWVCELSAKQSAETEAAEVAGIRQRMSIQESMSCQNFEVCESRLRAESTAAHTDDGAGRVTRTPC